MMDRQKKEWLVQVNALRFTSCRICHATEWQILTVRIMVIIILSVAGALTVCFMSCYGGLDTKSSVGISVESHVI